MLIFVSVLSKNSNYTVQCISEKAFQQPRLLERHFYLLSICGVETQKAKFNPSARLLVPLKLTKISFLKSQGKPVAQQGAEPEGYGATPPTPSSFRKSSYPVQPLPFPLVFFYFSPILRASGPLHLFPFLSFFHPHKSSYLPERDIPF